MLVPTDLKDPFSSMSIYEGGCEPRTILLNLNFALLLWDRRALFLLHTPVIAPGVMVCTWDQGTLLGWPCIALFHLGIGRQKLKPLTFRQKKNNPFLGQDYSDYQQMMLRQEHQLIRVANFPHSWLLVEVSG